MIDTVSARVSILVTIVDGGETLRACLNGIRAQTPSRDVQVLVPWDASVEGVDRFEEEFPEVTFLAMGEVETEEPPRSPTGQHELFDRRRSAGLANAEGDVVCILEDRGVPAPDWLHRLMDVLGRTDPTPAVVGGAVECGVDRLLNRAVFLCDFGRYQPPFEPGPREYVTDVNCGYTREALDETRELWSGRYHETTVNWALQRNGGTLFLSPEPVVYQVRRDLTLIGLLRERLAWGRLFAYTRAREVSTRVRLGYAALSPALPFLLLLRHARMQFRKGRFGSFIAVSPLVFLLVSFWALGEFRGYLSGRP